ncbi:MAG: LptF/LptG family permease, partial [Fusobacteriaceae bacterium]
MKIFEKYILEELKLPVIFAVSVFTFIFLIDIIVTMMENILVRGISLLDTARILSFYLPPVLSQTIPMGVFLGIMITFSKLTKNSETTALTSMGISLKRMMQPVFILCLVITAFIFFLQESIIPRSFEKLQYITVKIAGENPVFQLKDKTFISDINDFNIYINKMDDKGEKGEGVLIFQKEKDLDYPTVLIGKKAFWRDDALVLGSSDFYKFKKDGALDLKGNFMEKKIPLSAYASNFKLKISELETKGVLTLYEEYKNVPEKRIEYLVEINKKIAVP